MGFLEGAERFASVAWWFLAVALAISVALILADVAVGIPAARHARRGGGGRDA